MNAPYNKNRCLDFPHSFWAMQTRAGVCLVMLKRLLPVWMGALQQLGAAQVALAVNKLSPNARRDVGSVPGLARSPGGGHGSPLQYSCLENLMNRGAWWATVRGVAKSRTWLKQLGTHTAARNMTQQRKLRPKEMNDVPKSSCLVFQTQRNSGLLTSRSQYSSHFKKC